MIGWNDKSKFADLFKTELEREDVKHHMWTLVLEGNLHLAPVENLQKILDVGTGSGIWAMQAGEASSG